VRRPRPTAAKAAFLVSLVLLLAACAPVVVEPGPTVGAPALGTDAFVTADGAELPVRVWMPVGPPSAVIVAVHGFNDYSNFFEAPGTYFADRGITSYAYDQRGFGAAPHQGKWAGHDAMAGDLRAVLEAVRARHAGTPLYVLGMSMGGAVVMVTITGDDPPDVDGTILVAPAVWGRATMPWYQRAGLWLAVRTVPSLRLSGRGLGRVPSDNREMLKALGRDPLVIKETRVDTIHGLVGLMDAALEAAARFDARALILYGSRDEIIPRDPTELVLARLPEEPSERRRVAVYDTGYHMLLRDLQAETVWRDIAAWIAGPSNPLPSGAGRRLPASEALRWGSRWAGLNSMPLSVCPGS